MARRKTAPQRREAMGGLAKGLAVIRTFTRDHAALSLSDIARSAAMPAATTSRKAHGTPLGTPTTGSRARRARTRPA